MANPDWSRIVTEAQRRRALRRADIPWSEEIVDPRDARGVRHGHLALLSLMVVGFASGRTVLRRMEDLSEDLAAGCRRSLGLPAKVADTTLYRLVCAQGPEGFRQTVRDMMRAAVARKDVQNDLFPFGVMSFDGKSVWTSTRREVAGAKIAHTGPDVTVASFSALRAVQTSSAVRPCVDMELIAAKEGEAPAFREMFPRVCENFGKQFLIATGDAGLLCRENAKQVTEHGKHYLWGLKGNQERLLSLAEQAFAACPDKPQARSEERRDGNILVRELHTVSVFDAPGVDVDGAEQLWRITQRSFPGKGEPTQEVRYYLSSIPLRLLTPTQQLQLVRLHWGIENNHNWTMDVMLLEDDRQPCQASKAAIEVICWLRIIAYNLLAAWRARLPKKDCLPCSWARAMELLRDALVLVASLGPLPTLA
jgi:hypothetical protein